MIVEELANVIRMSDLSSDNRHGIPVDDVVLQRDQVGVWYFRPSGSDRGAITEEATLDVESGSIPAEFDRASLGTYSKWAQISNRIEEQE